MDEDRLCELPVADPELPRVIALRPHVEGSIELGQLHPKGVEIGDREVHTHLDGHVGARDVKNLPRQVCVAELQLLQPAARQLSDHWSAHLLDQRALRHLRHVVSLHYVVRDGIANSSPPDGRPNLGPNAAVLCLLADHVLQQLRPLVPVHRREVWGWLAERLHNGLDGDPVRSHGRWARLVGTSVSPPHWGSLCWLAGFFRLMGLQGWNFGISGHRSPVLLWQYGLGLLPSGLANLFEDHRLRPNHPFLLAAAVV
mmetsp:Transcript_132382/g.229570  ORF Transcript_132382/g.229570 Transcript_132382/m.229570 type:complete len:256 (+) Transcript_132382:612-1379(+)